jgi:hypothetical protein
MQRSHLTWKQIIYMMVAGLPACGLVLFLIRVRTGHIGGVAIVATLIGYVTSCALLIALAHASRSKRTDTVPPGKHMS